MSSYQIFFALMKRLRVMPLSNTCLACASLDIYFVYMKFGFNLDIIYIVRKPKKYEYESLISLALSFYHNF